MQKYLQNVLLNIYEINGGFNLYNIFHLYKYSIELAEHNCKCKMRYNLVLLKVTILSTSEPRISLLVAAVTFFFIFYFLHYSQFILPNQGLFTLGGTVAEWLLRCTCNPEATSSTPALSASGWILSSVVPSPNPRSRLQIANWIAS